MKNQLSMVVLVATMALIVSVAQADTRTVESAPVQANQKNAAATETLSIMTETLEIKSGTPEFTKLRAKRLEWFKQAKFGLFIHWNLSCIPAGEWNGKPVVGDPIGIEQNGRIPGAEYQKLAEKFNPTKFDADAWTQCAVDAGMKYVVFITKHVDGFAMFHSKVSPYNVYDATPWKHDPLKELQIACQKRGLILCVYYSQSIDFEDPDALGNSWDFGPDDEIVPRQHAFKKDLDKYLTRKSIPQIKELLTNYGPIGMIWFDNPIGMNKARSIRLAEVVRAIQPEALLNSRLTIAPEATYLCDVRSQGDNVAPLDIQPGAWETCATLNWCWAYRAKPTAWPWAKTADGGPLSRAWTGYQYSDTEFKTPKTVCLTLVDIVSKGGNYLLDVGPTDKGEFPQEAQDILRRVGTWLKSNGEAIYGAGPTPFGAEFGAPVDTYVEDGRKVQISSSSDWRCTTKPGKLYIHIFNRPANGKQLVPMSTGITKAVILGDPTARPLDLRQTDEGWEITLPETLDPLATVLALDITGSVLPILRETKPLPAKN